MRVASDTWKVIASQLVNGDQDVTVGSSRQAIGVALSAAREALAEHMRGIDAQIVMAQSQSAALAQSEPTIVEQSEPSIVEPAASSATRGYAPPITPIVTKSTPAVVTVTGSPSAPPTRPAGPEMTL